VPPATFVPSVFTSYLPRQSRCIHYPHLDNCCAAAFFCAAHEVERLTRQSIRRNVALCFAPTVMETPGVHIGESMLERLVSVKACVAKAVGGKSQ
jgi:hypothetical protein